jgi:hypothetical protein
MIMGLHRGKRIIILSQYLRNLQSHTCHKYAINQSFLLFGVNFFLHVLELEGMTKGLARDAPVDLDGCCDANLPLWP